LRASAHVRDSIRPVPVRILIDYRPALRQRTGVGEYVHETARALVATAAPSETLVLFSSSWKDRLPVAVVPGADTVDRRVPVRVLNFAWHRLGMPPVEWLAGGGLDVVHAAHPLLIPSRQAARLVTIHDLDFLDAPERTTAEIGRDYPALTAAHARRADQVVAVSTHTAQQIETRLGVPRSRISVCPPGAPTWTRRTSEPASGGCILFLGTLEPRKNLGVLLDAYAALVARQPQVPRLVLAGRLTPAADALIRRTRERPLAGRVDLPGYVSEADKRALLDRALVLVLPSHVEGFGLPAVEAMAAGVPVIASNGGALPETVGTAGHLFAPDDTGALGDALESIVGDHARRHRMSDAGWRHVQQFTWARTAQGVRDAWRLAVEHRRARRRG
jgi:glycosyltransferase involved in cell wall biosynthesis